MIRRSGLMVILVGVALLTACTQDGGGDETTTGTGASTSGGPATTSGTPTTSAGTTGPPVIDLSTVEVPVGWACHFLAGYVAVTQEEAAAVEEVLGVSGIAYTAPTVGAVLEATSGEVDSDAAARVDAMIEVLQLPDAEPLQVVIALRGIGFQASPIHVAAFAPHWAYKPGTDPEDVLDHQLPDVGIGDLGYIAVVDSGVLRDGPDWMSQRAVIHDDRDVESAAPSHGNFVSAVIRQIAPEYRVTFASAQPIFDNVIESRNHDPLPANVTVTSELQVAEAIARILDRHEDETSLLKALNLSLGTYTCDPTTDELMVTTASAMNDWSNSTAAPVFAAAGNENVPAVDPNSGAPTRELVPFWPAALGKNPGSFTGTVYSIAAINQVGVQTVWELGSPLTSGPRPWVTNTAPGSDVVSLAGPTQNNRGGLVCWSGSSFATATATAAWSASGAVVQPTVPSPGYSQSGLTYFNPASGQIVTNDPDTSPTPFAGC